MSDKDIALIAHLMRRAGFGASRDEIETRAAKGYEATVEELVAPENVVAMPDDLMRRYHADQSGMISRDDPGSSWLYRMITTSAPLQEKMALFWHGVFATGYNKIAQGKPMMDQIRMFRRHGLGSFKALLVELSKDPAMIYWLDNHDNHKGSINENFGRELLELFSMGVGNYSEQDIRECARAFTGYTIGNTEYMAVRARRDSIWPYGRLPWHFRYDPDDHDDGEKEFLGQKGSFNGDDIIDIICGQPATARFLARHLYNFFVADEAPVPQWPYKPPRDPDAVEALSEAYTESGYDIQVVLRTLFNSDFFRSEDSWYAKVKSPADLVVGVLRLTGEFHRPRRHILERTMQIGFMGQELLNPPTVEGWHQGTEWIDTGTLVHRLNFATEQLGDWTKPGVRAMTDGIIANAPNPISAERLVDGCLDQIGAIAVSEETRSALVQFASTGDELDVNGEGGDDEVRERIAGILALAGASVEFQRA